MYDGASCSKDLPAVPRKTDTLALKDDEPVPNSLGNFSLNPGETAAGNDKTEKELVWVVILYLAQSRNIFVMG